MPILDPKPSGRPMDYQLRKIQKAAPFVRPPSKMHPYLHSIAQRDQDFRGTCTGQSGAIIRDLQYLNITKDLPTPESISHFKLNVVDELGTTHDVLFDDSFSAESIYQGGRKVGNITYPEGGETRFCAKYLAQEGANLESQWHTDKKGTKVWQYPPGPRKTSDGGLSPEDAAKWASDHKIEGWAMLGDSTGNGTTWDEICDAIAQYDTVYAGIPVFENYNEMQGGDGTFPDPKGDIAGYHALAFVGYDDDWLYLVHSWGTWCGMIGKISKQYFLSTVDESVYLVLFDTKEPLINAGQIYGSLNVIVKAKDTGKQIPADVKVNGVVIGLAPQKFATEVGKTYEIEVSFMGYQTQKKVADDSSQEIVFELDANPAPGKSWFRRFIEWLYNLLGWK